MTDNITILIVDDEPNNLMILKVDLEDAGYKILTAKDGVEGWDVLQKNKDVIKTILIDRMMPNMNGIEFTKKIKSESDVSGIPVIMQTAAAEKEQVVDGIKAGVYYYLTKPYDINRMLSVVSAAVSDYANYSQLRNGIKKFTRKLKLVKEARFEIQTLDDAQYLSTFLSQFFPSPENVVFGISELLVNAIEHGNLDITYDEKTELNKNGKWEDEINRRINLPEYSSKCVDVSFIREEKHITFNIKDQGKGFDWKSFMEISAERAMDNHGRGIALSKMMSFEEMEYLGCGNEVVCKVSI